MSKSEFLSELEKRLKYIPSEDREDAIEYYNEYLKDMNLNDDDDVSGVLENPKEIASKIIGECTEKHINEQGNKGSVKKSATALWLTILGLLSLPLSAPAVIVVFVLLLTLLIVIISTIFSVFAVSVAFGVAGVCCLFAAFFAGQIGQVFVVVGTGTLFIAVSCLVFVLGILLIRFIGFLCSLIFGRKRGAK